ncbi:adenine phosphoribosyltransferase [Petrotoga sp. 9PW.55.5.1]|jgi:adenine phosphoribosyltransferase|uniref:adenine phosphoribosyltransferase n=1 Tax=Petrotoga sp. 9PW.55.5.1 TaxID=1308979 RepID=UPI000DC3614D|nr:adenine phosphoribosyltransferase [Petrotoga sp. 9PW.55.5.1]RAO99144.1 adenine phosphoribosyltransferase [Petrotoga sp. 9PW.55.5.1]
MNIENIKEKIRDIPDFPEKGVIFKDITPLLKDPKAFKFSIEMLSELVKNWDFSGIVSPESRGFIFASPLAFKLEKELIPVRKPGKLPYDTYSISYELEYGNSILEMHIDAVQKDQKVIIIDDVLATGGTTKAIKELIEKAGGEVVGVACLAELTYLKPRDTLKDLKVSSLIEY